MQGMITREELARRLGVSIGEIRRREMRGQIKHSAKQGRSHLFRESLVEALSSFVGKGRLQKIEDSKIEYRKTYKYRAEDSQRVFPMIKIGKPLEDIIVETGLHPGVVRAISEEYADITGAVLVLGSTMQQINALPLDGNFPLTTGEEILEIMKACAEAVCEHCHDRPGTICKRCVSAVADEQEA